MGWLFIALLFGAGGYFLLKSSKKSKKPKSLPKPKGPRTVMNLQTNDIVTYFGDDYMVEGKLVFDEDGSQWFDYRLVGDDEEIWLSVEDDDRLEVGLFRVVKDLKFTERPPEYINYDGDRFELEEYGRARATRQGKTGFKNAGSVKYFEYEGPGGRMLSVEQWGDGGSYEVSVGETIRPEALEILPGDDVDDMSNIL